MNNKKINIQIWFIMVKWQTVEMIFYSQQTDGGKLPTGTQVQPQARCFPFAE